MKSNLVFDSSSGEENIFRDVSYEPPAPTPVFLDLSAVVPFWAFTATSIDNYHSDDVAHCESASGLGKSFSDYSTVVGVPPARAPAAGDTFNRCFHRGRSPAGNQDMFGLIIFSNPSVGIANWDDLEQYTLEEGPAAKLGIYYVP